MHKNDKHLHAGFGTADAPQTKTEVTDRHRLNDNDIYNPCIYYCIEQASRVCFKMDFKF